MLPEPHTVDVVVVRGRLSFLPGEICEIRPERGNPYCKVWLNSQKSAPPIVPMKRLTTVKERGGRLEEADQQSRCCCLKTVVLMRYFGNC